MKIKHIFLAVCALCVLTGCTDKSEIRDRAFVRVLYVDSDKCEMRGRLFDGGELSGSGKSLADAFAQFEINEKKIFTGHTELLILKAPDFAALYKLSELLTLSPTCAVACCTEPDFFDETENTDYAKLLKSAQQSGNGIYRELLELEGALEKSDLALMPLLSADGVSVCVAGGGKIHSVLSSDAARGLALIGAYADNMPFSAGNSGYTVSCESCRVYGSEESQSIVINAKIMNPAYEPVSDPDAITYLESCVRLLLDEALPEYSDALGASAGDAENFSDIVIKS